MLSNVISGARSELIRGLKNGRGIFGLMSVVLSLGLDRSGNGSFAHPHRSGKRTLFSLIRKAKGLH